MRWGSWAALRSARFSGGVVETQALLIDVNGDDFPGDLNRNYAIPTGPGGNPFATSGGAPEVWAYGLRNPWRCSFDRLTHDTTNTLQRTATPEPPASWSDQQAFDTFAGSIVLDDPVPAEPGTFFYRVLSRTAE